MEFVIVVPLDLLEDSFVSGWRNLAVQDQHTIADELPDLIVSQSYLVVFVIHFSAFLLADRSIWQ